MVSIIGVSPRSSGWSGAIPEPGPPMSRPADMLGRVSRSGTSDFAPEHRDGARDYATGSTNRARDVSSLTIRKTVDIVARVHTKAG